MALKTQEIQNQQELWNSIAPEWHKHKEIPSQLSIEFLKKQKGNILDLGSGSGRHLTKIKSGVIKSLTSSSKSQTKGRMYLVDFSEQMIKLAEKRAKEKKIQAEFIVSEMNKIPFEDNFFDAAICISALHCTPKKEHKKIIKELHRVLKLKAQALIGVWNFNSKRFNQKKGKEKLVGWTDKGKRYYYLFDEPEVHRLFQEAGFKILSTHNSEMMINFIVQK